MVALLAQGVEPELFTPGELLGSRTAASDSRSDPGAPSTSAPNGGSGTWFSTWFGSHQEAAGSGRRPPPGPEPPLVHPENVSGGRIAILLYQIVPCVSSISAHDTCASRLRLETLGFEAIWVCVWHVLLASPLGSLS